MKFKEWFYVGVLAFLGVVFCLPGCASREEYLKRQYTKLGPCFMWGGVEKGARKAEYYCRLEHPVLEAVYCTRQEGHKGRHHCHVGRSCLAVWK